MVEALTHFGKPLMTFLRGMSHNRHSYLTTMPYLKVFWQNEQMLHRLHNMDNNSGTEMICSEIQSTAKTRSRIQALHTSHFSRYRRVKTYKNYLGPVFSANFSLHLEMLAVFPTYSTPLLHGITWAAENWILTLAKLNYNPGGGNYWHPSSVSFTPQAQLSESRSIVKNEGMV